MPKPWVEKSENQVRAGNGLVTLSLARLGKAVVLRSLARGPRAAELLAEPKESDPLWELEFRDAQGEHVSVSSADAPAAVLDARAGDAAEIVLRWPGVPIGGSHVSVEAMIRVERGDPVTRWRLDVANPEQKLSLFRVSFPIIANAQALPRASLAFPTGWGLLFDDALRAGEVRGTYPSMTPAMQFMAVWRKEGGVYLAAHDPAATHKELACEPDAEAGRLRLSTDTYMTKVDHPAPRYALPYEAAVGAFAGDWYDAARLHRAWAIEHAPWMSQGELRTRRSTPQWLKDIDIWCLGGGTPAEAVEPTKRFAAYFGVPTALHWYNWHQIPFDDHYPEYFPTKEGFAKGVADLQTAGIKVMPYINGRLWDPRTASWASENAEAACAKDEHMKRYEETYGSGVPLVVMCPYTEKWQAKVTSLVDRLVHECGVDGVYVDQISAAGAKLCFDPSHGHDIGGGGFWAAGYRRMLERARKTLPKDRMLTTEESADPWIDLLDAFLLVNTPPNRGEVIPLFPAVYGGRTITFGFQYFTGDDLDRSLPFRAKMARAFAWGAQLGWIGAQIFDPKYAHEAEYLRNLAQCRHRAHEFLAYGEMIEPPAVRGVRRIAISGSGTFGGDYHFTLPSVLCSAWRSDNGDVGIALTNMTDEEQTARVNLSRFLVYGNTQNRCTRIERTSSGRVLWHQRPSANAEHSMGGRGLGLKRDGRYRLARITAGGEEAAGEIAGPRLTHEEVLPPRSAVVVRVAAMQ